MKYLNWEKKKNEILKKERGISFEEIAYFIESEQIIAIEEGIPYQALFTNTSMAL
jgi:uncharacterized DUF497 family protein